MKGPGVVSASALLFVACTLDFDPMRLDSDAGGGRAGASNDAGADSSGVGGGDADAESGSDAGGGQAGSDAAPGTFDLMFPTSRLDAILEQWVEFDVEVVRDDGHRADVTVTVDGLPAGVMVDEEPLVIEGGHSSARLGFFASNAAELATSTALTVRAHDGSTEIIAAAELYVRGQPGSVDTTFGQDGISLVAPDPAKQFTGPAQLVVLDDDRIVVACTEQQGAAASEAVVVRLAANGARDGDFGVDGKYSHSVNHPEETDIPHTFATDIVITKQGRVTLVGNWQDEFMNPGAFVVQITQSGALDPAFTSPAPLDLELSDFQGVAEQPGVIPSLLAVGGYISGPLVQQIADDGALGGSSTFTGIGGFWFTFWDPFERVFVVGGTCDDQACLGYVDEEGVKYGWGASDHKLLGGKSLVAGTVDDEGRYYMVGDGGGWRIVRYIPLEISGSDEDEFVATTDDVGPGIDRATALALTDDWLYVSGITEDVEDGGFRAALGRYAHEGGRDLAFGMQGIATLTPALGGDAAQIGVQSDGRIVLALVKAGGDLLMYRIWN